MDMRMEKDEGLVIDNLTKRPVGNSDEVSKVATRSRCECSLDSRLDYQPSMTTVLHTKSLVITPFIPSQLDCDRGLRPVIWGKAIRQP